MLESTQQIQQTDVVYYLINHQSFRVAYIILTNFQNMNSHILPTKILPGNPIADY